MSIKTLFQGLLLTLLMTSGPTWSAESMENDENAGRMIGDLIIARPLGIVATGVGTAAFLISLPFTVLSDNVGDAADALVVGPASATFKRCLGCIK